MFAIALLFLFQTFFFFSIAVVVFFKSRVCFPSPFFFAFITVFSLLYSGFTNSTPTSDAIRAYKQDQDILDRPYQDPNLTVMILRNFYHPRHPTTCSSISLNVDHSENFTPEV